MATSGRCGDFDDCQDSFFYFGNFDESLGSFSSEWFDFEDLGKHCRAFLVNDFDIGEKDVHDEGELACADIRH
jgi:hypothetical protein